MAKLKRANHHWWPECVSERWADNDGKVTRVTPEGSATPAPPNQFGAIGDGHHIKLGEERGEGSPWDMSFETQFDRADRTFSGLLNWLDDLPRCDPPFSRPIMERIVAADVTDIRFLDLIERIVSLVIRSPGQRSTASALALDFMPDMSARKRDAILGLNMRNSHPTLVRNIGGKGKALVLFSPEKEFVFGDGLYSNVHSPTDHQYTPKMLVPLLPWMAVAFIKPSSYFEDPRLSTLIVNSQETEDLNHAVQVYSKNEIFYRFDKPVIEEVFAQAQHLRYRDHRNPVDRLFQCIPGIPPRDESLDTFFEKYAEQD